MEDTRELARIIAELLRTSMSPSKMSLTESYVTKQAQSSVYIHILADDYLAVVTFSTLAYNFPTGWLPGPTPSSVCVERADGRTC